jgi:hypothetical protein
LVPPHDPSVSVAGLWRGTAELLEGRWPVLLAVAAPFTLLVDMTLRLFGPAAPTAPEEVTSATLLWLIVLPALIGSLGQLAVVHLLLRPEDTPRTALAAAFVAWPGYVAALMLSVIPTGIAALVLVLPGIYVASRLFPLMPIALGNPRGSPVEMIRTCWRLTAPVGLTLFGFFLLGLLGLLGFGLLAGGIGAAIGSVLTLLGADGVARFAAGLVSAIAATFVAVATAGFASHLYQTLR